MILAVMSYPKHYHITQLAIKHAVKHIPNISEIAIIWDNNHEQVPSAPLNEVIEINLPKYVYTWNSILENENVKGWIGQQIIKLHLDNIIKKDFIILDGDTIINQDLDPYHITYANSLPRQHGRYKHINEILGIGPYDFGSCPFMYVKPYWLENIRELCFKHSNLNIIDKFIETCSNNQSNLNEWELISTYIFQILKLPRRIEYFNRRAIKTSFFSEAYNDEENFVLDGPDDLSINFWKKHKVFVDANLIQSLNYKNC